MKVAFFIGHHKTGSTALQNYLAANYLGLLRQGILYPAADAPGLAANLAAAVADREMFGEGPKRGTRLNEESPHNMLALRLLNEVAGKGVPPWRPDVPPSAQIFATIQAQITVLAPHTVLMCSEIFSRLADQGARKVLPLMYRNFGAHECSILLNLRRPDLHIASWHLQRMKFREKIRPLRHGAQAAYADTAHFRFDRIVERWGDTFPKAQMRVRNYSDVIGAGGSVPDFFSQSGIDHLPVDTDKQSNISIPYALAEILRLANFQSPEFAMTVRSYLFRAMERISYLPNDQVELFGQENRTALCDAFAPVHAALSKRLGLDGFFPDLDQARICNPVPELRAARDALAAVRADCMVHLKKGPLRGFLTGLKIEE